MSSSKNASSPDLTTGKSSSFGSNNSNPNNNGINTTQGQRCLLYISMCTIASLMIGSSMLSTARREFSSYNLALNSEVIVHPQSAYLYNTLPLTISRIEALRGPKGRKYSVLVTGAAGFVGMYTCLELKRLGMTPIGYDNVNSYYSTELKESRIAELQDHDITFVKGDVCDTTQLKETIQKHKITRFIHLAAQAGVRYSLDHPLEYTRNNIDCTVYLLETLKELDLKETLVYASSSSVYGNNEKVPFQETDPVDDPASLYAATKRSNELIAHTYWNLYNISSIGLRFFTVYGPYGRPDMAPWIFTDKISNNETIKVFNHGDSRRDFTYIDDIVQGVVNALFVPYTGQPELVNLGNGRPVVLADFVRIVEERVGHAAQIETVGMQKGDVPVTYADISKARRLLGYNPNTPIEEGITNFVKWFREHNASKYRMSTSRQRRRLGQNSWTIQRPMEEEEFIYTADVLGDFGVTQ